MGRISDEDIATVRDATDVVSLISESVVLKRKGRLHWGNCPFHSEKTPSFKVDQTTGLWHCFGCGAGGDVFGFVIRRDTLEFPEAVRFLADRANITLTETDAGFAKGPRGRILAANAAAATFYHQTLLTSADSDAAAARKYLAGRGFGIEIAKCFQIGWAAGRTSLRDHLRAQGFTHDELILANLAVRSEAGSVRDRFWQRVIFPIRDLAGKVVAFGARSLGDDHPKYVNTGETVAFHKSRHLYGIEKAKSPMVQEDTAIIVEGYTDVIAMHIAGLTNVVGTLGTALTQPHIKLISRFASKIVFLFDADEAGLRAAEKAMEFIHLTTAPQDGRQPVQFGVATVPEGKDPADYVSAAGPEAMRALLAEAPPLIQFVIDRRLASNDTTTPAGRSAALSEVASVLATIKGSLLAQDYMNYVADRLQTKYVTIDSAVSRAKPAYTAPSHTADEASHSSPIESGPPSVQTLAEQELVGLLIRHPELRECTRDSLGTIRLIDSRAAALIDIILDSGDESAQDLAPRLSAVDPMLTAFAAEAIVMSEIHENPVSAHEQLLTRLKEFDLERQIIEMQAKMRTLDSLKHRQLIDDLFVEITALQKEYERLRTEEYLESDRKE
ncbi:MAG: DNA primase [Actinobacteria bacterium]|nr:DNA primase [Actinomycetota bacterium]MCL5887876.1 DNA primase [Actinomycetota bacterium]